MLHSYVYIGIKIKIETLIDYLNTDNWEYIKSDFLSEDTTLVKDSTGMNMNSIFYTYYKNKENEINSLKTMKKFLKNCKKKGIKHFTTHSDDCKLVQIESQCESVNTCKVDFNRINEIYFKCREYVTNTLGIYDYEIVFINHVV